MATPIHIGAAGGEYMESVTVVEWAVDPGAQVHKGDVVVTVETAKAATDIEAPCDGILTRILAEPGEEIALTAPLGLVGADAEDVDYAATSPPEDTPQPVATPAPETVRRPDGSGRIVASPAARRAAARMGVDLAQLRPTSPTGRLKLRDVEAYADTTGTAAPAPASVADEPGPLHVLRGGADTGNPVVLLHGFASDAQSWYPLDRTLGAGRPVIRIDLPNHGRSPKRRIGGFKRLAREIVDAFDALDLDRAHVVGHSLGGACALALADIRAPRLASLTLIAPAGLGPAVDAAVLDGLARASKPESLAPWLKAMVADPDLVTDAFASAAMARRADPALRASQQAMLADLFPDGTQGFSLAAALGRLELPARIVWGRADSVLPWRDALQAPGHAGLHLIGGVGHLPQLEVPDLVAGIIAELIRGTEAQ